MSRSHWYEFHVYDRKTNDWQPAKSGYMSRSAASGLFRQFGFTEPRYSVRTFRGSGTMSPMLWAHYEPTDLDILRETHFPQNLVEQLP